MRRLMMTLAVTLIATATYAGGWNSVDSDNCSSSRFRIDGRAAHVSEESFDAPGLRTIKLTNAPLRVTGGNSRGYTVVVCKAAADAADLKDIHVSVENGQLVTRGPSHDDWTVTYKVSAPDGANLEIDSRNGPVAIRDLDGTLNIRLENGPLALRNVRGDVDAETTNGPVSVDGGSGTIKVKASNGPLSVALEDGAWTGGTLDASTSNGPLSVKVGRNFNSGVLVEAHGSGTISCKAEACGGELRSRPRRNGYGWDDTPRKFELGRGPQVVRISTVNGPVTIKE